ncbi:hypothetical protein PAXRUDRAFT_485370 [Paxillus rubicundulus Ve08.2h10]|uniref:Unplaced genomic scaffold scaffold_321, whole genome shotgun sequence n=1 Tax=Paxillus rubicundulus Ve08.2h10 TaxID=930991 RepID=A0A0D0E7F9_9AGAM|nr:hypothetical protein PAXRUDRAFT_485370 [Paxillus rubicundulus Ve08.2h10]
MGEADTFLLIIVGVLFPPAAVVFISGCGIDLCIHILLTMQAKQMYGHRNWTNKSASHFRCRFGTKSTSWNCRSREWYIQAHLSSSACCRTAACLLWHY